MKQKEQPVGRCGKHNCYLYADYVDKHYCISSEFSENGLCPWLNIFCANPYWQKRLEIKREVPVEAGS